MEWMFQFKGPVYLRTIRRKIETSLQKRKNLTLIFNLLKIMGLKQQ